MVDHPVDKESVGWLQVVVVNGSVPRWRLVTPGEPGALQHLYQWHGPWDQVYPKQVC